MRQAREIPGSQVECGRDFPKEYHLEMRLKHFITGAAVLSLTALQSASTTVVHAETPSCENAYRLGTNISLPIEMRRNAANYWFANCS